MKVLLILLFLSISTLLTLTLLITGKPLYFTHIPTAHSNGVSEFSPVWLLLIEGAVGVLIWHRIFIGVGILGGTAFAMTIDLYPLWILVGNGEMGLKIQTGIIVCLWLSTLCGVAGYRHFME